jgi:hypothetical protein
MNVEIGAEAALFPEKEYINGIFVAVWSQAIINPFSPITVEYLYYLWQVVGIWILSWDSWPRPHIGAPIHYPIKASGDLKNDNCLLLPYISSLFTYGFGKKR